MRSPTAVTLCVVPLLLSAAPDALAQRGRPDRAPEVGAEAPDFELVRLTTEGEPGAEAERVRLSDLQGKPVALIFGSYT